MNWQFFFAFLVIFNAWTFFVFENKFDLDIFFRNVWKKFDLWTSFWIHEYFFLKFYTLSKNCAFFKKIHEHFLKYGNIFQIRIIESQNIFWNTGTILPFVHIIGVSKIKSKWWEFSLFCFLSGLLGYLGWFFLRCVSVVIIAFFFLIRKHFKIYEHFSISIFKKLDIF